MKNAPAVGTVGEQRFTVAREHIIDFADNGMPAVLCTPSLIWFLEHAARNAVLGVLEPGESTVGVHIEVDHLAPTPIGQVVTCQGRVIQVNNTLISLQLEARDPTECIARGFHRLRIIHVDRFARRVEAKSGRSSG